MTEILNALFSFQLPRDLGGHRSSSIEEGNKASARKVRAGSRTIMTPQQRQEFLKNSEYGKLVGVSDKFKRDNS